MKSFRHHPYLITGLYYLAFISLGLTTASFGPTLQGLANNTGSTLAQISSLFVIRSMGYLLGSLSGGRIYDRVKGHPILSSIIFLMAVVLFFVPLAQTIYILGLILFFLGYFEGVLDVGCNTLILWLHRDRVPPFMNGLHAFFGIGTTIIPLIVAQVLLRTQSVNWSYWILSLIILPPALGLIFTKSPQPEVFTQTDQRSRPVHIPLLVISCLLFFLYVGSELGFSGWIYTYATQQVLVDPATAAGINAAFWAGFTVSRLFSILLAVRLKPDQILWIDLVGSVASLALILVFPDKLWAIWAGSIGTGVFMASIFPTILNDAQTRMHMTGSITSWFFVGASLGGMALPFLIGQIIGSMGPIAIIYAVLASIVGSMILFGVLIYIRNGAPPPRPAAVPSEIQVEGKQE